MLYRSLSSVGPSCLLAAVLAIACTENPREVFRVKTSPADPRDEDAPFSGTEDSDCCESDSADSSDTESLPGVTEDDGPDASASTGSTETNEGTDVASDDARDAGLGTDESQTAETDEANDPGVVPLPNDDELAVLCGPAPVSNAAFTQEALREAAADCAVWHYCRFAEVAEVLDARVAAHEDEPSEGSLDAARVAWQAAMTSWSQVELFQFGPLGSRSDSAGKDMYEGQGIRDLIYAWPTTSRCRVDEQIVTESYATRGMDGALISGRGLYGLEALMFYSGSDTACTSNVVEQWDALSDAERSSRKNAYASAISDDIVQQMRQLIELWSPDGGNFRATFVGAGGEYPDEHEVMKVMAWSLVYLEREVKDWKVGIPAGYTLTHPVSGPETPHALMGTENIRANLEGFRRLFQGCGADGEGLGFDDWLAEAGHSQLANDTIDALDAAQALADVFPPLHEASQAELDELYQALRALTSLLKAEFFGAGSPLNLELPGGIEGDTD